MQSYGLSTHIWNNRLKSVLLLLGFPFLLLLISFAFALFIAAFDANPDRRRCPQCDHAPSGGHPVVARRHRSSGGRSPGSPTSGIIDAITGAQLVDRKAEPRLWNLLENLCISRGITMPALRIIETPQRNAFASGIRKSQYSVTVTRGLMEALDDAELEAVLAHELTHIRNRDVQLLVICRRLRRHHLAGRRLVVRSPRALCLRAVQWQLAARRRQLELEPRQGRRRRC